MNLHSNLLPFLYLRIKINHSARLVTRVLQIRLVLLLVLRFNLIHSLDSLSNSKVKHSGRHKRLAIHSSKQCFKVDSSKALQDSPNSLVDLGSNKCPLVSQYYESSCALLIYTYSFRPRLPRRTG